MKKRTILKAIERIPDDAEVTYRKYLNQPWISLLFTFKEQRWMVDIAEEENLKKKNA